MNCRIQHVRMTPFLHPEAIITTEQPVSDNIIIRLNELAKQHNVFQITVGKCVKNGSLFLDAEFMSSEELQAFCTAAEAELHTL